MSIYVNGHAKCVIFNLIKSFDGRNDKIIEADEWLDYFVTASNEIHMSHWNVRNISSFIRCGSLLFLFFGIEILPESNTFEMYYGQITVYISFHFISFCFSGSTPLLCVVAIEHVEFATTTRTRLHSMWSDTFVSKKRRETNVIINIGTSVNIICSKCFRVTHTHTNMCALARSFSIAKRGRERGRDWKM